MITSIRFLIISSLLVVIFLCSLGFLWISRTYSRLDEIGNYHLKLKSSRILLLEFNQVVETITNTTHLDSTFYYSSTSQQELEYNYLKDSISSLLTQLSVSPVTELAELRAELASIKRLFNKSSRLHDGIISLYKRKGFKDYGLEGTMRNYAHCLYDQGNQTIKFLCLQLRRHEKDFLIRKDLQYLAKFDHVLNESIQYLKTASIEKKLKTNLFSCVYYYGRYFHLLVRVESKIGVRDMNGELYKANLVVKEIERHIENVDAQLSTITATTQKDAKLETTYLLISLLVFLAAAVSFLSSVITKSVRAMAITFERYINSGFNFDSISSSRSRIKEFNIINLSFLKMAKEINIFANFFREKVLERTKEITSQKEEIEKQQEKIEKQYKVLVSKNNQLLRRKSLLLRRNADIRDSLIYAKRIQKAIQPAYLKNQHFFAEMFVYSKAKDVVSGDFFLTYDVTVDEAEPRLLVLAGDCTGHGVPGAFMSMLGINILRKVIKEKKEIEPGAILSFLNRDLMQLLASEKDVITDGMDIAVVLFDKKNLMLHYSLAKFASLLLQGGQITEMTKGRNSIGNAVIQTGDQLFASYKQKVQPGDCLYLFSDGFQDQFGGPLNKKFKRKTIVNLIQQNHDQSLKKQRRLLKENFKIWKGDQEQTDDVLFAGMKF